METGKFVLKFYPLFVRCISHGAESSVCFCICTFQPLRANPGKCNQQQRKGSLWPTSPCSFKFVWCLPHGDMPIVPNLVLGCTKFHCIIVSQGWHFQAVAAVPVWWQISPEWFVCSLTAVCFHGLCHTSLKTMICFLLDCRAALTCITPKGQLASLQDSGTGSKKCTRHNRSFPSPP